MSVRILAIAVSTCGFGRPASNLGRTQALCSAIEAAAPAGGLVLVPAGYWCASRRAGVVPLVDSVADDMRSTLAKFGCTLIAGVDIEDSAPKTASTPVSPRGHPYFGFAVASDGSRSDVWQQVSVVARDADGTSLPTARAAGSRTVLVSGIRALPLLCGEMHNAKIREAAAEAAPELIVVIGHKSLGQGLLPTLIAVHKRSKTPVVHVQHLAPRTRASIHWVDRDGLHHAEPVRPSRGEFWLAPSSLVVELRAGTNFR